MSYNLAGPSAVIDRHREEAAAELRARALAPVEYERIPGTLEDDA